MSVIKQLISIVIPVFNESESIGFLLDEVINVMSVNKLNHHTCGDFFCVILMS